MFISTQTQLPGAAIEQHALGANQAENWSEGAALVGKGSLGKPLRFLITGTKLLVADGLGLTAGYALLLATRPITLVHVHEHLMLLLGAAYVPVAFHGGAYAPVLAPDAVRSVQRAWVALTVTAISVAIAAIIFGQAITGVLATTIPALLCAGSTIAIARVVLASLLASRWWQSKVRSSRTIILVDGVNSHLVAAGEPHGTVLDVHAYGLLPDLSDPSALERLGSVVDNADRVVVACADDRRMSWIAALRGANVPVEIVVDDFSEIAPLGAGRFEGRTTLKVATEPLALEDRVLKRLFDIVVASLGLLCLAPLLLIVAVAVKLDSQGPALFRQPRIGRGNRLFMMHKFRSMRIETQNLHGTELTRGRNDDRVTRVGRFIRATSIDELPQLIDVLRGDMSIVGPRPHALGARAGGKLYWEVDTAYWHRHAVKPGMTGLAQVRGFRGTTFVDQDLQNRLDADLEYVRAWSLAGDIGIIFRTVMALTGRSVF